VLKERVHRLREDFCNRKVVHIGEVLEVVYVEFVVLRNIGIGMVVVPYMIRTVVDMVLHELWSCRVEYWFEACEYDA